jgi:hypothetical protein
VALAASRAETSAAVVSNNQWLLSNLKTLNNGQFGFNPISQLGFLSSSLNGKHHHHHHHHNHHNHASHIEDRYVNVATAFKLNQNKNSQNGKDRKPIKRLNSNSSSVSKHFFDTASKGIKKHSDCEFFFSYLFHLYKMVNGK